MKQQVLDKGFVEVVDSLGTDLTIVNSARVSFGKRKDVWDLNDEKLVRYLVKNKHFSPFRHVQVQFHIKAPEFVMRQWYKHVIGAKWGAEYIENDHAWNEISGRYVEVEDFYHPALWRLQSANNKQGSDLDNEMSDFNNRVVESFYRDHMQETEYIYKKMINEYNVAKEMARIILPISQYTEVYWTASFQALMNFIELRDEQHSQYEIQEYARVIKEFMKQLYPETVKIWFEERV